MLILILLLFTAIALLEAPSLIKEKKYGELIIFTILWGFGLTLGLLNTLEVEIPKFSTSLGNLIYSVFKIE